MVKPVFINEWKLSFEARLWENHNRRVLNTPGLLMGHSCWMCDQVDHSRISKLEKCTKRDLMEIVHRDAYKELAFPKAVKRKT